MDLPAKLLAEMKRRVRPPFNVVMVVDDYDGVELAHIGELLSVRVTEPSVGKVDHRGQPGVAVRVSFGDGETFLGETGWTLYAPKNGWVDAAMTALGRDIVRLTKEVFEDDDEDWDREQKAKIAKLQKLYAKPLFA